MGDNIEKKEKQKTFKMGFPDVVLVGRFAQHCLRNRKKIMEEGNKI